MATLPVHVPATAQRVVISEHALTVDLGDRRSITAPIEWYPRLARATPRERNNWHLIGGGFSIHWEDINEDISVEDLLAGRRSAESHVWFRKWLAARRPAGRDGDPVSRRLGQ